MTFELGVIISVLSKVPNFNYEYNLILDLMMVKQELPNL